MAIVKCPKCSDPNFDDGACGCGHCDKCKWRQTCTSGGWYLDKVDYSKLFLHEVPHDIKPLLIEPFVPIGDGVVFETRTMGRAGAAIEYEAHKRTLDLLRRARDIMMMTDDVADESVNILLKDIAKQCPVLAEEDE